jgi:serine/threonine-protein kinase
MGIVVERSRKSSPLLPALVEGMPGPGDVIAGKYRVEGVLGVGGMGVVLSARHLTLGQPIAIKILAIRDQELEREAKARLLREARAAAALTSDHVVRIYDMGEEADGQPFIVMERLFGADLSQVLQHVGPLPVEQAATLLVQACRAVGEANALGIVHRDLKPSNLFLTRRSDGGAHVKVLDFGIAKSLAPQDLSQETLTGGRLTLGSPSYMSPEQVRDARQVDGRTDIWSLGMILYELLTGKVAFQGNTLPGVCAAIVADTPPTPSSLRKEIPAELDQVILRCLEKEKTARYRSAEALAAALEPFAVSFLDFVTVVPFSWLPETLAVPVLDPVAEVEVSAPRSPEPAPEESPRAPVQSHERTLESGKPVYISAPRVSGAPSGPPADGVDTSPSRDWIYALAGFALILGLGLAWWFVFRSPERPPSPPVTSSAPAAERALPPEQLEPANRPAPSAQPPAPVPSERAQPGSAVTTTTAPRSRARPPEAISSSSAPEIRLTR